MQKSPPHGFFRRMLFPYSGTEVLSFKQSIRVLFTWMVLLPLAMSTLTFILTAIFSYSLQKIGTSVLFTFLSGCFIFGGLGILVVLTNNSSARIRQRQKTTDTTGGRYGS